VNSALRANLDGLFGWGVLHQGPHEHGQVGGRELLLVLGFCKLFWGLPPQSRQSLSLLRSEFLQVRGEGGDVQRHTDLVCEGACA
jgi:hypothetical protein